MKNIRVLRDKQKIGSFIINALTITEGWGIKDNSRVYFSNRDLVTLEEQNNGQILKKGKFKLQSGKYYVLSEKASATEDFIETMKYYMKMFDEGFENLREKN